MEKQILTEVNRTREIMGLGQLIREARDPYEVTKKKTPSANLRVRVKKTKLPESFQNLTNLVKVLQTKPFGTMTGQARFAYMIQILAMHYGNGNWEKGFNLITSEKRETNLRSS